MSLRSSLASFFGWDKPTPIPTSIARAQQMFQMLNGYTPAWTSWNGQIYESELVRAAIEAKAQHMSKLKFEMIGNAKPSLKANLRRRPCAILTWSQWFAKVSRILDVYNTCFLIPTFDQYGEMDGIYPAVPANAELVTYGSEHELYLRYTFSGGITAAIEFKYCGIITRHQLKNDFFGERNDALKPTMELINMVNQGIDANIKNAASYKFLATLNNFSKDSDLIKERKRFTAANFGKDAEDNHGVLLFPNYYSNITQIKSVTSPKQAHLWYLMKSILSLSEIGASGNTVSAYVVMKCSQTLQSEAMLVLLPELKICMMMRLLARANCIAASRHSSIEFSLG